MLSARVGLLAGMTVVAIVGCTASGRPAGTAGSATAAPASAPTAVPAGSVPDSHEAMRPLAGTPLAGRTGLRLLVGADPPFVLDIDRGTRRRITGLPRTRNLTVGLQPVGPDAVISSECAGCGPNAEVFVLGHGSTAARRIGTAAGVAPAVDGRGVWLTTHRDKRHCTLAEVDLRGRARRPARPLDCDRHPRVETPLGLLLSVVPADETRPTTDEIRSAAGGRLVVRAGRIYAVLGRRVLTAGPLQDRLVDGGPLLLGEVGGAGRQIPRPTSIGTASDGLPSPDGRYLAISFEHPAWPGPRQRMDVWLLDLRDLHWQHVPSMPVPAALKFTGLAWTPDGRLVLLGEFDEVGTAVAVWRPGQAQLAIRRLPLPAPGGDAFLPW